MTTNMPNTPKIGIVAYEGAQMSAVLGLGDIIDVANRMAGTATTTTITYDVLINAVPDSGVLYDAIVMPPNLTGARGKADEDLHQWIWDQHQKGAVVCSACAGAFWLGRSGILDGRPATTHWALESEFKEAFPRVQLHPEHILLDDNDIVTAGRVMAWMDLGLHLVRRWLGPEVVSRTCRQMLIDPTGREQRNYRSFRPNLAHKDAVIRDVQIWMEGHADSELSIAVLAKRAGISTRSLQRKFSNATGYSLNQYVQELRVEKAKGLLELTSLPVSEICWKVGYQDVSAFSRLFKSTSGLSARDYRRRFQIV
ncbi:helix-turn-helix domain-containing protein [Octadecabacter sp. G9-8]|uniref:Helix-turn-helix domain-containing protein n=1 Tax=Octadecabacter dasysiphoniae TaxID=2909341 RepID=A0ABS9CWV3_9RHOB|nr:helix-turn-helix domain-containing protein [Octadecabacter dasysiphoniae]MCF2870513.1 helix-turn-helix domain-containing protein [Octadecabacter dasysiphoniae]